MMLVLLAVLALAGATPETTAAAPAAEASATKDDGETKICKTKPKMGTRFKERVCYSKAEYERRQLEERQGLDRMQRIPAACHQTGGC